MGAHGGADRAPDRACGGHRARAAGRTRERDRTPVRLPDRRRRLRRRRLAERLATAGSGCWSSTARRTSAATPTTGTTTPAYWCTPTGRTSFTPTPATSSTTCRASPQWRPYEHRVLASVDGRLLPVPINLDTVNRLYGLELSAFEMEDLARARGRAQGAHRRPPKTWSSRKVGRDLYKKFFRGYTRKQWGLDPSELDASVTARIPTRTNRDDRYFTDTYQAMPRPATRACSRTCCDHPNIKLMLDTDYREIATMVAVAAHRLHRPDRHLLRPPPRPPALPLACDFEHVTLRRRSSCSRCGTVNYPNELRLHAGHRVQAPHRPEHRQTSVWPTSTRAPRATPTTRCRARERGALQAIRGRWPRTRRT